MVAPCRGEDYQHTVLFNTVIGNIYTTVSMPYYKARFVQVRDLGYTILPEFADTSDPGLSRDVTIVFDVTNDA